MPFLVVQTVPVAGAPGALGALGALDFPGAPGALELPSAPRLPGAVLTSSPWPGAPGWPTASLPGVPLQLLLLLLLATQVLSVPVAPSAPLLFSPSGGGHSASAPITSSVPAAAKVRMNNAFLGERFIQTPKRCIRPLE